MITNEAIVVSPVLAPAPYTLVDQAFVSTLHDVEARVSQLEIVDAPTAQIAADLQSRLTRAGTGLEKARMTLIRPLLDAQNLINETARPVANRIEASKNFLKKGLSAFDDRQKAAAELAELARQKEVARLQKLADEEEAARQKKAAEIAKAAADAEEARLAALPKAVVEAAESMDFDDTPPPAPIQKTETEIALEKAKFAPVAAPAKVLGVTFRVSLRIAKIDVDKLPEPFILRTADEALIRKTFCVGWKDGDTLPVVDGVTFGIDKMPVNTGREKF